MKKWKWNWGTGLALALGLFVLSMAYTMYLVSQQKYDLVTSDYYEQELAYQETINRQKIAARLSEACKLRLHDGKLSIDFPKDLEGQTARAKVLMYCQTDADKDFTLKEEAWKIKDLTLPSHKVSTGKWIAKIHIDTDSGQYYFDPSIVIP